MRRVRHARLVSYAFLYFFFDHYSLLRLTNGNFHSSSDLLYFTLALTFTWTNYFKSQSLSPFCFFGQKFSKSHFPSLFSSDKNTPSPTSIPQKHSKTFQNSVFPNLQTYSKSHFLSNLEKFPSLCVYFLNSCRRSPNSVH